MSLRTWAARLGWAGTPLLPALWLAHRAHPRLGQEGAARWGLAPVPVEPGAVWILAASVGEVRAAAALLPHLSGPVLLTADTVEGLQVARRAVQGVPRAVAALRPVDHPWVFAPLWAEARPRALILVEGLMWPGLVERAVRDEVPVLAVQARPGRTLERLGAGWYAGISAMVARSVNEGAALEAVGLPVVGVADLKGDAVVGAPRWTGLEGAVVAASTRQADEEAAVLAAWRASAPGRPLVIAPRHPARFEAVWRWLRDQVPESRRASALPDGAGARVLLLDTLGDLDALIAQAGAVWIGGTTDPAVGGHSPTAAWRAGVPVLAGPCRWSDPEAFERACPVEVSTLQALPAALALALGRARRPVAGGGQGALACTLLAAWLDGPPAPERSPRPWMAPVVPVARGLSVLDRESRRLGLRPIHRLAVPVVSVGSANARGAGKTSATAWVARHLRARGHRVGIAVRGYGRERLGGAVGGVGRSVDGLEAWRLGDEGARLALAGWSVAASADRHAAGQALVELGCSVVVLDDGLQHHALHRDLDVVVVAAAYPGGRGPLPAGEAREAAIPARSDVVLVIGQGFTPVGPTPWVRLTARAGPWRTGDGEPASPARARQVLVGVGAPGAAVAALRQDGQVEHIEVVADHAPIEQRVQELLEHGAVALTAKDAARLSQGLRERVSWREVELWGDWPDQVPLPVPQALR